VWIGFIWLRIWTCGGLLWTGQWTFTFHNMLGISWLNDPTIGFSRKSASWSLLVNRSNLWSQLLRTKIPLYLYG
jgi:hypothetical protein